MTIGSILPSKHLLGIEGLSPNHITALLDLAETYVVQGRAADKKTQLLRGRTLINLFFEASTRTQSSFELAGKRLGADVMNMSVKTSSVSKGETLIDTATTLNAMRPDILVVRHQDAWLIKFDGIGTDERLGVSQDYGRIEYAYYLMAKAAGIEMSESRLLEEHDRAHFMTKRFDRDRDKKHHLQTLCGLAHLDYRQKATHDVSQLFMTINRLGIGYSGMEQAFRRVAFNIMAANCDDHTKNVSFLLREGGRWELAPAYDVTHAYNPKGEWTYQHLMSVNGKFADITWDDLMVVADRFGVGTAARVVTEVRHAVSSWPDFARVAKVSQSEITRVRQHHVLLSR